MGTALAAPYVNIYVFCKEVIALKQFLKRYSSRILLRFFRFLDDILILLLSNASSIINELQNLLNNVNSNLKYTFETSNRNIQFLDVNMTINSTLNRLETSLYVKPSNTFQYLQYSSAHPRHILNNILLSLSNRIIRISSSPTTKWNEFYNLFTRLLVRGHNAKNILQKILSMQNADRLELINRPKKLNDKLLYKNKILPFLPQIPNIRQLLENEFSTTIPQNFRFVHRCGSNLSNLLTRSRYPHSFANIVPEPDTNSLGCYRCKNPRCTTCNYIIEQNFFISTVTNQIYNIPYSVNCDTSNLIYLITCNLCHSQYVGTTGQTLRNRFNHHLTAIRHKYWHDTTCPEHFNLEEYSIENLTIIIIETNFINEQYRLDREHSDSPALIIRESIVNFRWLPGRGRESYKSIDTVLNTDEAVNYPTEFLNSFNPSGMPLHNIRLKVGSIIMLLRDLDSARMCNATRLIVKNLRPNTTEATILTGCAKGEEVIIPRIPMILTNKPFQFKRLQFPVRLAYAMTINKAQGQSLQVYVATSRVGSSKNLYVLAPERKIRHIVYRKALE
ncbi:unnamed protein product [Didymodactylos carnosus]|uniref:GIY-YIG domain-containing protein n=1 Tax=Didymodactylos carnosus TaxID=1234261 RepID=A0A814TR89_9BILA|nr:unnamed protein product [Didymodactylos carnosus]CAF3928442.1 unnamed protein product [Didymodactylos carnosus]